MLSIPLQATTVFMTWRANSLSDPSATETLRLFSYRPRVRYVAKVTPAYFAEYLKLFDKIILEY